MSRGRTHPFWGDRQGVPDPAVGGRPRLATLPATIRHLEGAAIDDALLLFDLLMSTVLLRERTGPGTRRS
jgi:hypothetical protein